MLSHGLHGSPEEDPWAKQDGLAGNEHLLASAVVAVIIPVWIWGHKSFCGCKNASSGSSFIPVFRGVYLQLEGGCSISFGWHKGWLWLLVSALGYLRAKSFGFSGNYSHSVPARNRTMSLLFKIKPDSLSSARCAKLFLWERASLFSHPN